jgi:hypothetical protein
MGVEPYWRARPGPLRRVGLDAAKMLGRNWLGVEIDSTYDSIASRRLSFLQPLASAGEY